MLQKFTPSFQKKINKSSLQKRYQARQFSLRQEDKLNKNPAAHFSALATSEKKLTRLESSMLPLFILGVFVVGTRQSERTRRGS